MKMKFMVLVVTCLMVMSVGTVGAVSFIASLLSFESGSYHWLYLGDSEPLNIDIIGFHQYAKTWYLFFRHNPADVPPYDNISISIECNGATSPVVFLSTFYDEWNSVGELTFSYDFAEGNVAIPYNSHIILGDLSSCELYASSISFDNNSAYDFIDVETIPLISVLENYDCGRVESTTMNIADSMSSFFGWMGDIWTISWYVYSMALIIFAVFGIPMFVFLAIRYSLYKILGYKIVERRV